MTCHVILCKPALSWPNPVTGNVHTDWKAQKKIAEKNLIFFNEEFITLSVLKIF
jgi:hypothetical protein